MAALPPGTVPNPALPPADRLSWHAALLPFVERDDVARKLAPAAAWDAGPNADARRTPVKVFVCPGWQPGPGGDAPTTYLGVAGVGPDAADLPAGHPRAGVFGHDRRTPTPAGVPDGTSNTLMVLESTHEVGPWARGGPGTVRGLDPAARPYLGAGRPFGSNHFPNKTWFGHAKDVPAAGAMADGSVRQWLPSRASPEVLEGLATAAGGEPAAVD